MIERLVLRYLTPVYLVLLMQSFVLAPSPSAKDLTSGSDLIPDTTRRSVTIPMTVPPDPPITAMFTIITPPDSIIAGIPFLAVVSIYNKDGLIPGIFCYPGNSGSNAIYQDSLDKGATPNPTVTTNEGNGIINQAPSTSNQVAECFINGVDTIDITLYRAPYHNVTDAIDTMHQLVVILGSLSATAGPFKLLPVLQTYKLQLENGAGTHVTGRDTLAYPSGEITVYSVAYDLYGNKRGRVASNWSVTGTLHQPNQTAGISQVYYDASLATGDESGSLFARALRSAMLNDSTEDSLGVFIKGPSEGVTRGVVRTAPFVRTMQSKRGVSIVYGGYSQTKVSAMIYSIKGQLLKTIFGIEQGNGLLLWKYDDKFERPVTNGCYIIRIFAGPENIKRKIFLSR